MSPTEITLERIRMALIPWEKDIEEKKMFGGTCFLFRSKIALGSFQQQLRVRVISEKTKDILSNPCVGPMQFKGEKPMKEFFLVSEAGFDTLEKLKYWVALGIEHATSKSKHL